MINASMELSQYLVVHSKYPIGCRRSTDALRQIKSKGKSVLFYTGNFTHHLFITCPLFEVNGTNNDKSLL